MKTFENRFGAIVELRRIGDYVVIAKVSTSLHLDRFDSAAVSDHILSSLLPSWIDSQRLYDGSYVLVGGSMVQFDLNTCVPRETKSLPEFVVDVELDDGLIHTVHISLDKSDEGRRDYIVLDTRFVHLRGKVTVEVDDDEKCEC